VPLLLGHPPDGDDQGAARTRGNAPTPPGASERLRVDPVPDDVQALRGDDLRLQERTGDPVRDRHGGGQEAGSAELEVASGGVGHEVGQVLRAHHRDPRLGGGERPPAPLPGDPAVVVEEVEGAETEDVDQAPVVVGVFFVADPQAVDRDAGLEAALDQEPAGRPAGADQRRAVSQGPLLPGEQIDVLPHAARLEAIREVEDAGGAGRRGHR
jgi:hypothetical protein